MDYNKYFENYLGEKSKLIYLIDKVKFSNKSWDTVFTDFLTPEDVLVLNKLCLESGLKVKFLGGIGECERVIGAIYKDEMVEPFPIEVLKITGNFKFESLNHRDYLGTVLSLGIKREKIGDINLYEDGAEIYMHSDMCSYIGQNINKIKHTGVKTSIIKISQAREKVQKFYDMKINITSLRLDSIVAALINLSRANGAIKIKGGDVKLNYAVIDEVNAKVKRDDLISIKGFGRYKIEDILGLTKSDRLILLVKKYL